MSGPGLSPDLVGAFLPAVVRPLLAPFGRRVEERGELGDAGFAGILVLVLVSATVADRLGINVIPGAFLIGAILPARALMRDELGRRLRELTVVVLPVFLAYSGLALQSGVISPTLQVGGVLMALVTTVMTAPLLNRFLDPMASAPTPSPGRGETMVVRYKWDGDDPRVATLQADLDAARQQAVEHPLYSSLTSVDRVRTFMSLHVFAVWDFMSLLKALQQRLTCVEVPWMPQGDGLCRRLINDIVLVEESDECGDVVLSHFELYLRAMDQAGADRGDIDRFFGALDGSDDVLGALDQAGLPEAADQFVRATWDVIGNGELHELAAVFAFGRENLIPAMFTHVLEGEHCVPLFVDYLERHVEVDEEEHTPMAVQMVLELCGDDPERWASARNAVLGALDARRRLWDGILAALPAETNGKGNGNGGPNGRGPRLRGGRTSSNARRTTPERIGTGTFRA